MAAWVPRFVLQLFLVKKKMKKSTNAEVIGHPCDLMGMFQPVNSLVVTRNQRLIFFSKI
jgi:hypothetical protein